MTVRTQGLHFNRPRLVRLLGDPALADTDATRQDFAERLSQWLSAMDTVTLHAALQSIETAPKGAAPEGLRGSTLPVDKDVQRVREALAGAIMAALPPPEQAPDASPAYAPYQKRHADLQRQMDAKIGPLRARVRQALSKASPALQQLAALDAAMAQALGAREQKLLSSVPVFLERRFEQSRRNEQLAAFGQAWQEALLAELDTRLQPVMGLMDAWSNEVKKQP